MCCVAAGEGTAQALIGPRERSRQRGPHGHHHVDKQRLVAVSMIGAGLIRTAFWIALILAYLFGLPLAHELFSRVWFVALISLYANAATDFGQSAASMAQLAAADAHHDAEHNRRQLDRDSTELDDIERDIALLADLQPGRKAKELARSIRDRLQ